MIALDDDGAVVNSDWHRSDAESQLIVLRSALDAEGVSWAEGLGAIIDASRDEEFGRPVDNPLGARLIEVIRSG